LLLESGCFFPDCVPEDFFDEVPEAVFLDELPEDLLLLPVDFVLFDAGFFAAAIFINSPYPII
jgi:hypothetical protein